MKRYHLGYEEKQIVYAVIRMNRKAGGEGRSVFLKRGAEAIAKAREEMEIGDAAPEVRETIIDKIQQSIAYSQPWEHMGETYCSRGTFYQYRKQFAFLVADHMGLTAGQRRRTPHTAAGRPEGSGAK